MTRLAAVTLVIITWAAALHAEEVRVYESMTNVKIGPVFLTPAQREQLDARRHLPPRANDSTGATGDESAPSTKPRPSAGYFKSSNGPSRVWKDGDFVSSADDEDKKLSFPGDVKITRHSAAKERDGDDD